MLVSVGVAGAGARGVQGEDAVPQRFRALFARSARVLSDWSSAKREGRSVQPGPPTKSDVAAAKWDIHVAGDDADDDDDDDYSSGSD